MTLTHAAEEDSDAIGCAMVAAAFAALGSLPEDPQDEDQDEIAQRVIRALVAAGRIEESERARIEARDGRKLYPAAEPREAVATAFWLWAEKVDLDASDVLPSSIEGARYLGLAQGLAAARAMSEAMGMVIEGSLFAFNHDGATLLATEDLLSTVRSPSDL
jgi:hypothetical protein